MPYTYDYPRPMVTVDCIVIKNSNGEKSILLIKRGNEPYKDYWALPGGFVDMDEDLENAAIRELMEETCIAAGKMRQLFTIGTPGRDPRGRTISVIYFLEIAENLSPKAGDDAAEAKWFLVNNLPENLAFDHEHVICKAIDIISA